MSDRNDRHPSEEMLQSFLDGELPSGERRQIEGHVLSCTHCTQELVRWSTLFDDLDSLGSHGPSADFGARVMSGLRVPEAMPWAARIRARLAARWTRGRSGHLDTGLLQELADGGLPARASARARRHLDECAACAGELSAWTGVMSQLSQLERHEPAHGFADRVMAALHATKRTQALAEKASIRRVAFERVLAGARRVVPRTRRAWAAISGAAVTPAVTFGLLLWAVFSHPSLTPRALVSFVRWQLADVVVAAWGGLISGGLQLTRTVGLDSLIEAMVEAPLVAVGGFALYAAVFTIAARVLYKNLIHSRSLRPRYASASAS